MRYEAFVDVPNRGDALFVSRAHCRPHHQGIGDHDFKSGAKRAEFRHIRGADKSSTGKISTPIRRSSSEIGSDSAFLGFGTATATSQPLRLG